MTSTEKLVTKTTRRVIHLVRASRDRADRFGNEAGAATAEYAIATMAAVGFAGLLVLILRSDAVRAMLSELIQNALTLP